MAASGSGMAPRHPEQPAFYLVKLLLAASS